MRNRQGLQKAFSDGIKRGIDIASRQFEAACPSERCRLSYMKIREISEQLKVLAEELGNFNFPEAVTLSVPEQKEKSG